MGGVDGDTLSQHKGLSALEGQRERIMLMSEEGSPNQIPILDARWCDSITRKGPRIGCVLR